MNCQKPTANLENSTNFLINPFTVRNIDWYVLWQRHVLIEAKVPRQQNGCWKVERELQQSGGRCHISLRVAFGVFDITKQFSDLSILVLIGEWFRPQGDTWQCLETFWLSPWRKVLSASSRYRPQTPPSILQCRGQPSVPIYDPKCQSFQKLYFTLKEKERKREHYQKLALE